MAELTLDELIERTRLASGLRNNQYYDSDQIIRYLNSGGSELYDIFTQANQHYVISEHDFTTTGPDDAVVDLPDDFQQGHSLEVYPDTPGQTITIKYLSNWLNRNAFGNGVFALAPGGYFPVYTFLDNHIRFYPPQCVPAAPFRLYYVPMWTTLAAGTTRTIEIDPADTALNDGGFIQYILTNGAFTDDDVGGSLTITWDTPNEAWDAVAATITAKAPGNDTTVTVDVAWPGGSFTNPAAGTASITSQPAGTRNTLPAYMASWSEYLVTYAAIAINTDRQRGTAELQRKLDALKGRVASILSARQEEPQQPPLTRGDGFGDGWGGGGWWP